MSDMPGMENRSRGGVDIDYIEIEEDTEVQLYEWRDASKEVKSAYGIDAEPVPVRRVVVKKGQRFPMQSMTLIEANLIFNFHYDSGHSSWISASKVSTLIGGEEYSVNYSHSKTIDR